jgi:small-conductance mechanosensitive channel
MIATLPVVFMIVGALMYALSSNGKVQEMGRILFAAGAFGLCIALGAKTVALLK